MCCWGPGVAEHVLQLLPFGLVPLRERLALSLHDRRAGAVDVEGEGAGVLMVESGEGEEEAEARRGSCHSTASRSLENWENLTLLRLESSQATTMSSRSSSKSVPVAPTRSKSRSNARAVCPPRRRRPEVLKHVKRKRKTKLRNSLTRTTLQLEFLEPKRLRNYTPPRYAPLLPRAAYDGYDDDDGDDSGDLLRSHNN